MSAYWEIGWDDVTSDEDSITIAGFYAAPYFEFEEDETATLEIELYDGTGVYNRTFTGSFAVERISFDGLSSGKEYTFNIYITTDYGRDGSAVLSYSTKNKTEDTETWELTAYNLGTLSTAATETLYWDGYKQLYRFAVTFSESGTVVFFTRGVRDTIGYLSVTDTYKKTTGVPQSYLAMDDSGYDSSDFKISYSVTANKTYYIWVRGKTGEEKGSSTLQIMPPNLISITDIKRTATALSVTVANTSGVHISGVTLRANTSTSKGKYKTVDSVADFYNGDTTTLTGDYAHDGPIYFYLLILPDVGDAMTYPNTKNTSITVAGTTYPIHISSTNLDTGIDGLANALYIIKVEKITVDIAAWSWTSENGTNTVENDTENAYNALKNKEKTRNFSHRVWNDLCDKVAEALGAFGTTWSTSSGKYATFADTKMTDTEEGKTLTAERFNSLRYNIDRLFATGISDKESKKDEVLAEYFYTLTDCLNTWISTL